MPDRQILRIGPKHPARAHQRIAGNVLGELARAYWALRSDYLVKMVEILSRSNLDVASLRADGALEPQALEREQGDWVNGTSFATLRDGVATMRVAGPMMRYADAFAESCGGLSTTYERLARDYGVLLASSDVRAILWDLDTPGGEVNGCSEFGAMLFKHRDAKPCAVYVSGDGCSAGYWIASAIGKRIAINDTALLGSIGVCATFTDFSGWEENEGIKTIEIVSSQSPKKRIDPATDAGRKEVLTILDALAAVFINAVAAHRDVSPEVVLRDFGQGGVFVGQDAIAAGLADEISSYEDIHAELRDRTAGRASVVMAGRAPTSGTEADMKTISAAGSAGAAAAPPVAQSDPSTSAGAAAAADPAAPSADDTDDTDDTEQVCPECGATMPKGGTCPSCGYKAAAAATDEPAAPTDAQRERARIRGIMELGRAGEEALVEECIADENCSVEQAALRLRQAQRGTGASYLGALRRDEAGTSAPSNLPQPATENSVEALSDKIANAGKPAQLRVVR